MIETAKQNNPKTGFAVMESKEISKIKIQKNSQKELTKQSGICQKLVLNLWTSVLINKLWLL